jgi:hypothetical protein
MSGGETLRRIRLKPELVEAIRSGRKMMTFRLTERPTGDYTVEEAGHPHWVHIDTGLRISIYQTWEVTDFSEYANEYFDLEGFESPQRFTDYVSSLYGGKLPLRGWAHLFWAAKDEDDFNAGRAIQPSEEIAQKVKEKFPDLLEDMKKVGELRFRRF